MRRRRIDSKASRKIRAFHSWRYLVETYLLELVKAGAKGRPSRLVAAAIAYADAFKAATDPRAPKGYIPLD